MNDSIAFFQIIDGDPVTDGGGVRIQRMMATSKLPALDPFLLLDEIRSDRSEDYIAGFPDHPHRGFETITYLLEGRMRHNDSAGHSGILQTGGAQRMTAGRGIIHSELPEMENGLLHGYQLWINLPADQKMIPASYKDHPVEGFPEVPLHGGSLRILSGQWDGVSGPIQTVVPLEYFDVRLQEKGEWVLPRKENHSRFIMIISGNLSLVGEEEQEFQVPAGKLCIIHSESEIRFTTLEGAHFLYLAAPPLRETIVRAGPFVMNTREELIQAFRDYESGNLA